ncbi:ABC transporter substrate-binding protein [Pleurocapsa sp. PCC 7319]|uniref:ABC transporter substrate-binding protein n=1 Tax=Pleurocapsa sp. PCC 7319 TaxID=118161 RepID=UPI000346CC90|nr:ABC transporter substrate-binding protein [Pleurocapsa sp. PCC 7319]
MQQNLFPEKLLQSLDEFVQQMHRLNKADNPKLIVKIVTNWTQAQPLLTKKLLQYLLQSEHKICRGQERIAVKKIILNKLIKEFEQDKLTLEIRKRLYQEELNTVIKCDKSIITNKDRYYLIKLQNKLGLSTQQCQAVKKQILTIKSSQAFRQNNDLFDNQKVKCKQVKSDFYKAQTTNKKSIETTSDPTSNYQQVRFTNQKVFIENKQSDVVKLQPKKWSWLLLGIPFLSLFIKGFGWNKNSQLNIANNHSLQQQDICVDLTSSQSPRMSLGNKLLSQEYNHLQPQSKITLNEGIAAFSRCEFSTARNKFQQSLGSDINNPEALIYANNAQAITQENFMIAVSVPLGSKPKVAWEILRGVAQAQAEINRQGGLQERLLLVEIVNDDNDPEIVRQVAKKLAADKNVLAVVGHNDSDSSLAASEIYQKYGLVMVSPTSSSTKLSGAGSYILRTTPSVAIMANTLADYALSKSSNKIAVCLDSESSASTSFAQEFMKAVHQDYGEIAPVKCDFAQSNFNPQKVVERAIAENADALLLAASVKGIKPAIAVAKVNQQRLPLFGTHSLYTFETIQQGKDTVAGMVLTAPWLADKTKNYDFTQTAMEYWGGQVNWRTAMAYDATVAIIQGLEQSDTRSELQSALTHSNFLVDGATGVFYFEQGDRLGEVQLAQITQSALNPRKYEFSRLNLDDTISKPQP